MSAQQRRDHTDRNAVLEATWAALRSGAKVTMLKAYQYKPWARVYLG